MVKCFTHSKWIDILHHTCLNAFYHPSFEGVIPKANVELQEVSPNKTVEPFAIEAAQTNEMMAPLHNPMPVIVEPKHLSLLVGEQTGSAAFDQRFVYRCCYGTNFNFSEKNKRGEPTAGSPDWKNNFQKKLGFARTAQAHQHTETGQYQDDTARFRSGNGSGVNFEGISACGRVGASSVRIQAEGGDVVSRKS